MLVYNTNQCRSVKDWFEWYARRWDVSCLRIESYVNVGEVIKNHVLGIAGQFKKLAADLTTVTGNKLDMDKLAETVWSFRKCSDLRKEVLETIPGIPCSVLIQCCL